MFNGFGNASNERHIAGAFTSIVLTGGSDCGGCLTPDLYVRGGAKIKKKLCVIGKTTLEFVDIKGDLLVEGNLEVLGDIISDGISFSNITAMNITTSNISTSFIEMNCGNIGNLMSLTVDNINAKDGTEIIINNDIDVQSNITAININAANITTSHLDLMCGNISNVYALVVDEIYSKGIDVGAELNDVVVFRSPPIFGVSTSGAGLRNQFWGYNSGYGITSAPYSIPTNNVAMGYRSLVSAATPVNNVCIGAYAFENPTGPSSTNVTGVIIGTRAQQYTQCRNLVAIGSSAGRGPSGRRNEGVLIGAYAGFMADVSAYEGSGSTCIGYLTGSFGSKGYHNLFVGTSTGAYYIGGRNCVIGGYCGSYSHIYDSVVIGYTSTSGDDPLNSYFVNCVSIGTYNGPTFKNGYFADNVFIGGQNVENLVTLGYSCTVVGSRAMQTQVATPLSYVYGVVCMGTNAWSNVRSTTYNRSRGDVIIGAYASSSCTYLQHETVVGAYAGRGIHPTLGGQNVILGYSATGSFANDIRARNTIVGARSVYSGPCGSSNVVIGHETKISSIGSNRNVVVGAESDASTFSDAVCLGFKVTAFENNSLNLGNVTLVNAGPVPLANLKVWVDGVAYALPLFASL